MAKVEFSRSSYLKELIERNMAFRYAILNEMTFEKSGKQIRFATSANSSHNLDKTIVDL